MTECLVDLKLPRFSTTTETPLNQPISALGAPSIFQAGQANFGNMTDAPMYVSTMLQKAKIEVSENGTKAARSHRRHHDDVDVISRRARHVGVPCQPPVPST